MEFIVSRNALLKALQHTRRAIVKNHGIPMFNNFILTFGDDNQPMMTVHASSGEIWITEDVVLDGTKDDLRPISIYYNDLLPAIKALDEQPLRFDVGESQVTVHHSIGRFRLPITNTAKEFLAWKAPCPDPEAKDCHYMGYEAPALKSIINRCCYAMANDELRPVMCGLFVNSTENYADYISSDGHKLVRVRKKPLYCIDADGVSSSITSFIIPSRIVSILQRVLPKTGDVDIQYQEKLEKTVKPGVTDIERKAQCLITIDDNLKIAFNPTDGRYPNYNSVIPESSKFQMLIDRRALTKSLDRLSLFANVSSELVRMTISNNDIILRTQDNDFDVEGEEKLPCECNLDNDVTMQIGMKSTNLSKTLKTMSTEKVAFHIQDSSRAVIITPQPQPDNEELTYLLMPMLCD